MSWYACVVDISPIYSSFQESFGLCSRSEGNYCLLSSGSDYIVHSFRVDLSSVLTYPYPAALSNVDARQKIKISVANSFFMISALLFQPCRDTH